jgi:hypothetical protein
MISRFSVTDLNILLNAVDRNFEGLRKIGREGGEEFRCLKDIQLINFEEIY